LEIYDLETYTPLQLLVNACLAVSVKFGIVLLLGIFVKIDLCLHLLLVNLGGCASAKSGMPDRSIYMGGMLTTLYRSI
jgi:hypothetical protein